MADYVIPYSDNKTMTDLLSMAVLFGVSKAGRLRIEGKLVFTPAYDVEWPEAIRLVSIDLETGRFVVDVGEGEAGVMYRLDTYQVSYFYDPPEKESHDV